MSGPITLKYFNLSRTRLQQSIGYTGYLDGPEIGYVSTTPSDALDPFDGTTTMEMTLAKRMSGDAWISLGWVNPETSYRFGVKIVMPAQVLDVGPPPYYQTASAVGAADGGDWTTPVADPSQPYVFSPQTDFAISCTALATPTSLEVSVMIDDLPR